MTRIYTWKCEICGKKIQSLSDRQLEFWKQQHLLAHKLKGELKTRR